MLVYVGLVYSVKMTSVDLLYLLSSIVSPLLKQKYLQILDMALSLTKERQEESTDLFTTSNTKVS